MHSLMQLYSEDKLLAEWSMDYRPCIGEQIFINDHVFKVIIIMWISPNWIKVTLEKIV